MIGWITLPRFASLTLARAHELPPEQPVGVHAARKVVCLNEPAEVRMVRVGMTLTEARSLAPEVTWLEVHAGALDTARDVWLQALLDFSSRIQYDSAASAYFDLTGHPRPAELMDRLLAGIRRRHGISAKVGIAPHGWIAKLAGEAFDAHAHRLGLLRVECIDRPAEFIAPYPTAAMPIEPKHARRLDFLGYPRIGDVARAPLSLLKVQFGRDAMRIYTLSYGGPSGPLVPNFPPLSLSDECTFAPSTEDLQDLEQAAHALCNGLAARLVQRDAEARTLCLWVETESGRMMRVSRTFSRAMHRATALRLAITHMLGTLTLDEPIARIRILLPELIVGAQSQAGFENMLSSREREQRVEGALRHVRSVFGEASVQTAANVPNPRRVRLLRAWREFHGGR